MLRLILRRRLSVAAGAVAFAAAVNGRGEDRTTTISVSPPLLDLVSGKCRLLLQEFRAAAHTPFSLSSASFSVAAAVPSTPDFTKGNTEQGASCHSGCLDRNSIANAAAMVSPSVVNISHVSQAQSYYGMVLGKSIGCGTIIDPDGTILTCAHVVVDRNSPRSVSKRKVDVTLQDGRQFEGIVINADFHSDIAVVKINSKTPLPAAKLGSSRKLRPGEWVVALGCPLFLQNTVTAGIVSCVDRKSSDLGLGGFRREYLQTDCAINEGNSGGPLVNLDGEVVGVNIMKIAAADGLSFAVPIDSVAKIVEHFKRNKRVVRPWLGLKMLELDETIVQHLKEKDYSFPNVHRGVLVPMVTPGSPAERAGFRPGDVVVEFDGRPVESIQEVIDAMGGRIGVPLDVLVKRAGDKLLRLRVVPEEANPEM